MRDGQTLSEINTDNNNIDTSNKEITGDSTMKLTSTLSENGVVTATVISPTTNKNNSNTNNISSDNNNDTYQ